MFLKKVARKSFKIQKRKKQQPDAEACITIVEPLYYEEPPSSSDESSEVEYIEDDPDYAESVDGARMKPNSALEDIQAKDDDLLALSVCFPSKIDHVDEDSCLSQEGILTKLPANLVNKSQRLSAKVELGTSLTESTTSEEHLTQLSETCSETCSTSMGSDRQENKKIRKLEAWSQCMEEQIDSLGEGNPKTAANLLELGTMYLQCEEFDKARDYFARAVSVSRASFDMPDLRIARALELYAIVESAQNTTTKKDKEQLECALSCLDTAFTIRYKLQGPEHIDTIETLSRIGRVQLKQRKYLQAKDSYYEVLKLREAIFGSFHPCVALASRALAICYTRLYQADSAKVHFQAALHIYERNGLGELADVVRKDLQELKRMKVRCEV